MNSHFIEEKFGLHFPPQTRALFESYYSHKTVFFKAANWGFFHLISEKAVDRSTVKTEFQQFDYLDCEESILKSYSVLQEELNLHNYLPFACNHLWYYGELLAFQKSHTDQYCTNPVYLIRYADGEPTIRKIASSVYELIGDPAYINALSYYGALDKPWLEMDLYKNFYSKVFDNYCFIHTDYLQTISKKLNWLTNDFGMDNPFYTNETETELWVTIKGERHSLVKFTDGVTQPIQEGVYELTENLNKVLSGQLNITFYLFQWTLFEFGDIGIGVSNKTTVNDMLVQYGMKV